jgi:hypothetical protein
LDVIKLDQNVERYLHDSSTDATDRLLLIPIEQSRLGWEQNYIADLNGLVELNQVKSLSPSSVTLLHCYATGRVKASSLSLSLSLYLSCLGCDCNENVESTTHFR